MHGHERLEYQLRFDGKLRYLNQSNYKGGQLIKKEVCVGPAVMEEVKRIIQASSKVASLRSVSHAAGILLALLFVITLYFHLFASLTAGQRYLGDIG